MADEHLVSHQRESAPGAAFRQECTESATTALPTEGSTMSNLTPILPPTSAAGGVGMSPLLKADDEPMPVDEASADEALAGGVGMSAVQQFDFRGEQLRCSMVDGEPQFVAADVARTLGYSATAAMTRYLEDDEKGMSDWQTPGGKQQLAEVGPPALFIRTPDSEHYINDDDQFEGPSANNDELNISVISSWLPLFGVRLSIDTLPRDLSLAQTTWLSTVLPQLLAQINVQRVPEALSPSGEQPPAGFVLDYQYLAEAGPLLPDECLYNGPETPEVSSQWCRARGLEVMCADTTLTIERAQRLHEQLGSVLEAHRRGGPSHTLSAYDPSMSVKRCSRSWSSN